MSSNGLVPLECSEAEQTLPSPIALTDIRNLEQRGLWLSIAGGLFMAVLGIGFAIVTCSEAVLLDGLFTLVGCMVGLMTLRVASLVKRPDDDVFHFGYAAYEPMLNLTKGLLMGFISLFALVSSLADAIQGGREVNAGWALTYAVIASAGCFAIALAQRSLARRIRSPLIELDATTPGTESAPSTAFVMKSPRRWLESLINWHWISSSLEIHAGWPYRSATRQRPNRTKATESLYRPAADFPGRSRLDQPCVFG